MHEASITLKTECVFRQEWMMTEQTHSLNTGSSLLLCDAVNHRLLNTWLSPVGGRDLFSHSKRCIFKFAQRREYT